MRIVHPGIYKKGIEREKRRKQRVFRKRLPYFVAITILLTSYLGVCFVNNPVYSVVKAEVSTPAQIVNYPWPEVGSASVGYSGESGALASKAGSLPVPSASTIKLLTALVVLQKKPLNIGEQGEQIRFDETDVALYGQILAGSGSVAPVDVGTTVSFRQALDAMLVASSNNIAYKLAVWSYGTIDAFNQSAATYGLKLKLVSTTVTDPTGLSAQTVTSADDMVIIAMAAMKNPLIAEIVGQKSVAWPVQNTTLNTTNALLDSSSVVGSKTGNTFEAGYCYVLTKNVAVAGQQMQVYVSVFGQPDRAAAFAAAAVIATKFELDLAPISLRTAGAKVGQVDSSWGNSANIITKDEIAAVRWKGQQLISHMNTKSVGAGSAGSLVGRLHIGSYDGDVILGSNLPRPSLIQRLVHGVDYFAIKK